MKKLFFLLIFLSAFKASAREIHMKLEELVTESEVIVIADLSDVKKWDEAINDYEETQHASGILTVRKAIWGKYKTGDRITLYWSNNSSISCPRNEHHDTNGKNYIWMLNYDDEGKFVTGTNQRVREVEEESRIDSILKEHPFFMRGMRGYYPENSPINLSLVYRNANDYAVKIPSISFKNGILFLHPVYRILFDGKSILNQNIDVTHDSILVSAYADYTVIIPVRQIDEVYKKGYHTFSIFLKEDFDRREYEWKPLAGTHFYYIDYQ